MLLDMNRTMNEAMEWMRAGDLHAATRAIQRGLHGASVTDVASNEASPTASEAAREDAIEGTWRVLRADSPDAGDHVLLTDQEHEGGT